MPADPKKTMPPINATQPSATPPFQADPNFKPTAGTVTFNPNGTVTDTSLSDKPLTKQEYNSTLPSGKNMMQDAKVTELLRLRNLVSQLQNQTPIPSVRGQPLTQAFGGSAPMAQMQQSLQQAEGQVPTIAQQTAQAQLDRNKADVLGLQIDKNQHGTAKTIDTPAGKMLSPSGVLADAGNLFIHGLGSGFDVVDNLKTLFSGGDIVSVKQARKVYSDSLSELDAQIKAVAAGGDPSTAIDVLNAMTAATVELESKTHRRGLDNLRYWLRDGSSLEGEIQNNKAQLERLRVDLVNAIAQRNAVMSQQSQLLSDIQDSSRRLSQMQ